MAKRRNKKKTINKNVSSTILTIVFSLISILYVFPIFLVVFNSFKKKVFINGRPFELPTAKSFVFLENYISGIEKTDYIKAFGYSLFITIVSVVLIVICCSMCAWYIVRVNSIFAKIIYYFCVFSMIVPFQMVMFTLSKTADTLKLNTPFTIPIVYLGFGAGLAVFMFCGFVKGIPIEIEEAAMIDGAGPITTFFQVVLPILKPTCISVGILQAMWIWNDYLLPYLTLDIKKYKTIPIAIQYLKGGYGSIDWGAMMAMLVLTIIPIIILYLVCQKYIIEGVAAGAVKG